MNERIAIVCNGSVPGSGIPNGAQGQRALGLYLGLTRHGFDVDIVSGAGAITRSLERWSVGKVRVPPYWRVLPEDACNHALNADYGTVIVLNWAGIPDFEKGEQTRLVYDFFSATMVEHSFITSGEELERRRSVKHRLLEQADLFIANGEGRARYAADYLAEHGFCEGPASVISVRLGLPWMGREDHAPSERLQVFLGGFDQAWVASMNARDVEQVARKANVNIHTVGFGQHLHFRTSRLRPRSDDVVNHTLCSFEEYCAINATCDLTIDLFEDNAERQVSYSTRSATSLACGCPVLTMGFTEIGGLIKESGAGWTLDAFSIEAAADRLAALAADREAVMAARRRSRDFWQAYSSPAEQVATLVEALS